MDGRLEADLRLCAQPGRTTVGSTVFEADIDDERSFEPAGEGRYTRLARPALGARCPSQRTCLQDQSRPYRAEERRSAYVPASASGRAPYHGRGADLASLGCRVPRRDGVTGFGKQSSMSLTKRIVGLVVLALIPALAVQG